MLNKKFKLNYRNLILTNVFNFLFVSFIFLSGIKYDYFQIRILIFALLLPCIIKIIHNKNFSNIKIFLSFFIILIIHSILNVYFENSAFTQYNFYGISSLTAIFVISFYYFDDFNKNIKNIINLFIIIFFISIFISLLNYQPDANLFCGGIKIFKILSILDKYLPLDIDFEQPRIDELRFSFKEFIFRENSHLGMVAPSIIIYLLYINSKKKHPF